MVITRDSDLSQISLTNFAYALIPEGESGYRVRADLKVADGESPPEAVRSRSEYGEKYSGRSAACSL